MASTSTLRSAALLTGLIVPVTAMDLSPTFKAEVLVEGISQQNYTDANGSSYVWVDPTLYTNFMAGIILQPGGMLTLGNMIVDPTTWRLMIPSAYRTSHYQDGNNQMWIRASMGAKVDILNRATVELSFVYDAEGGDQTHQGNSGANAGGVHLNEASVILPDILPGLGLEVGRQDWKLNLRREHTGFLYDSRANNPTVYGLDGIRANYNFEYVTFYPYAFILDATREERGIQINGNGMTTEVASSKDNIIYGVQAQLRPFADDRLFVAGGIGFEKNVVIQNANALAGRNDPVIGKNLTNYLLGIEWEIDNDITFFAEGVLQQGKMDAYRDFDSHAFSAGLVTNLPNMGMGWFRSLELTLQYDFQSGDRQAANGLYNEMLNGSLIGPMLTPAQKVLIAGILPVDPNDRNYRNFVAPMEGTSDMFIVEHDRYGELSELLVGNFQAAKVILEYKSPRNEFTLRAAAAHFALDTPSYDVNSFAPAANHFGQEYDLSLRWDMTSHTSLSVMGGYFLPGLGYRQVAAKEIPSARTMPMDVRNYLSVDRIINGGTLSTYGTYLDTAYPNVTDSDPIIFLGANVHVVF